MIDEELKPKSELPLRHAVVILEYREGQPWPVVAFEFRQDGHVTVKGDDNCGTAMPLLVAAAQKAAGRLVMMEIEGLRGTGAGTAEPHSESEEYCTAGVGAEGPTNQL